MEWLINRRRMMFYREKPPVYLAFEDSNFWRVCCEKWGDYNETVITDNGDNTVNIVTTFKSKLNTTVKKSKVISTETNVDNSGGTYTAGTTKEAIGITMKQCAAVKSVNQAFNENTSIIKANEFRFFTGLTSSGDNNYLRMAFRKASNLEEITLPANLHELGIDMLRETKISYLDVSNLTSTGQASLSYCTQLTELIFPEGFTSIGYQSIQGCSGLTYVEYPSTIQTMSGYCFASQRSGNTTVFIVKATTPPAVSSTYMHTNFVNGTVYVPDEAWDDYMANTDWAKIASKMKKISEYNPS